MGAKSSLKEIPDSYKMIAKPGILLIVAVLLIMLIIPLPTMVDIMIGVNFIFALTILIAVLRIREISDFHLMPTLLFIATIFSMAVYITAARHILTGNVEFDGRLIRLMSSMFFRSGKIVNLVIGFTIFCVLSAVNQVIIKKGAFQKIPCSLGTLDSFVKFLYFANVRVKVFIVSVIISGGSVIDILYHDKSAYNAIVTYIPLAVGNGILFMLHSLLVSIAVVYFITREVEV